MWPSGRAVVLVVAALPSLAAFAQFRLFQILIIDRATAETRDVLRLVGTTLLSRSSGSGAFATGSRQVGDRIPATWRRTFPA